MFFSHDVESVSDGRVDADGEVVVDNVARRWVRNTVSDCTIAGQLGGGVQQR